MKLFLFQFGLLQPLGIPIPGYLIQTDAGHNVLVDTGFPHAFIADPPAGMGPMKLRAEIRQEDYVISRLASVGVTPEDVDFLVCTHFDVDHAGNHELFTHAELVVQREHYEAAQAGLERLAASRPHWDAPELRYRLIDGDTVLLPGIELIKSGGHVPGHQSVLVRLRESGPILLAIDAIPHAAMANARTRPIMPSDMSARDTRESTRKLAGIVRSEGVALTVYGHDAEQWPMLRHAPDFYS